MPEHGATAEGYSINSLSSAGVVVPLVLGYAPVARVVDFGCKHGEWLSVFRQYGVSRVLGFDKPKHLQTLAIDRSEFRPVDLNQPPDVGEPFDLAICIEVAEHLEKETAAPLVKTLTATAPVVLFSAATPGQGGHGHRNEQPHSYWHSLFAGHGFTTIDCLRPRIWQDRRVAFWYRQNLFFYVNSVGLARYPALQAETERDVADDLELVHVSVVDRRPLLSKVSSVLKTYLGRNASSHVESKT